MPVIASSRLDSLINMAAQRGRSIVVPIPLCERCHAEMVRAEQQAIGRFVVIGMLLTSAVSYLILSQLPCINIQSLVFLVIVMALVGGFIGLLAGLRIGTRPLVRLCTIAPAHGTVELWFRNTDYSQKIIQNMVAVERGRR